jgi:AcrR family transcriptional regulator
MGRMDATKRFSPAGERLMEVATEAFYAEGITATGVDTLTARSGVSKPTLYAQFGSKRQLVTEVLRRRADLRHAELLDFLERRGGSPERRVLAMFDWLAEQHNGRSYRGCPFLNAAAELADPDHPAVSVVAAQKHRWRDLTVRLLAEAGRADAEELGDALLLLADGASARMAYDADTTAAHRARRTAARLLGVTP